MEKLLEFKPFKALLKMIGECMDFKGRTARAEYWWAVLGIVIIEVVFCIVLGILGIILPNFLVKLLIRLFSLVVTFLMISMSIRRLHDVNQSPLWLLLCLTAVGGIVPLYFCAQPSHPEPNEFGPVPTSIV